MNFDLYKNHCDNNTENSTENVMNCTNNSPTAPGSLPQATHKDEIGHKDAHCMPISIQICPTTGGLFQMDIAPDETVDGLRKTIAKKLRVSPERISLLYKEKLLKSGFLRDHRLRNGCRITLLPRVESGIMTPQPEVTVMQALDNLSDHQVNDFLAGKSPLTLAMKLGKHMMFLQLQLSTVSQGIKRTQAPVSSKTTSGGCHPYPQPQATTAHKLTVPLPPPPASSSVDKSCVGSIRQTPSPSYPLPPIVTPPPSPKSPSSSPSTLSPYTYPSAAFPSSTLSPPVPFDNVNTPPPSPCYMQHPIAAVPNVQSDIEISPKKDSICKHGDKVTDITRTIQSTSNSSQSHKPMPFMDNSTLAAAKRSLSMKLKEFSEQASTESPKETNKAGAVIETMQRIRHGVYSGTFSGTLNPALQDLDGKPKKSISTIIHILNDLLGASHPRLTGQHRIRTTPRQRMNSAAVHNNEHTSINDDSQAIRGKVERLQVKFEERKRRRQARLEARTSPYQPCSSQEPCWNGLNQTLAETYEADMTS